MTHLVHFSWKRTLSCPRSAHSYREIEEWAATMTNNAVCRLGTGHPRRERGAVAVEFALILPLLLMLVFGVISFGFVLAQKATLSSAVRDGARYGSVNLYAGDHSCSTVIARARAAASTIGMSGNDVTFTVKRGTTIVCSSVAAATPTVTGAGTTAPCTNPSPPPTGPETLFVEASFPATISIPATPINSNFALESVGVYRCEYNN